MVTSCHTPPAAVRTLPLPCPGAVSPTKVYSGCPSKVACVSPLDRLIVPNVPLTPEAVAVSRQDRAVRDARVVITMLPNADAAESVVFGENVAEAFVAARLARLRPNVLFVDAGGYPTG